MLKVVKRPDAKVDLVEIYGYLYLHANEQVAERFADASDNAFDAIARMPGIGSLCAFNDPKLNGMRRWSIKGFPNYLIFYRTTSSEIEIVRVLHGARDLAVIFGGAI